MLPDNNYLNWCSQILCYVVSSTPLPLPKLTLALIAGIMFQDIFHLTLEIVSIFVIVLGIVWIITQFKTAITKKIWGHWASLMLIDSLGIYKFSSQKFDWVLMQYSPKIHFETMIETLQPRLVIADGSNYKSLINRWKKTCKSKGVKFYDTATSGAFIYPLK